MYKMEKIKVYLSARISKDAHKWNNEVCSKLKAPISVFMPQNNNPTNILHKDLPVEVYGMDLEAMKQSDIGLLLPAYGRDCAWEVGWYSNSNKPIVVFVDSEIDWLRDWMIKGGLDFVITNNPKTWSILKKDPILKFKPIILIKQIKQLKEELIKIHKRRVNVKANL
jgi:nucleoside 2-deoxyribosyltransferase